LVEAATEAGAELRQQFAVRELLWEKGRVVGVRGQGPGGTISEERCQIVVGADGMHSFVARAVGALSYNERPVLACAYYGYWSGVDVRGVEIYMLDRRLIAAFATNDGLTAIFVSWPRDEFESIRA